MLSQPAPGVKCEACRDGAAAAQDDDDADDGLDEKSLKQLQAEAGRRKLPKTGTKAQLIDKIRGSAAAASGAPGAAATAPRGTLVVCPVSVIDSWMEQLAAHTRPGALRSYVYAGAGRNPDPAFLASFDVVIVSYNTLAAEHTGSNDVGAATAGKRKRAEGVHAVEWRRVVLDEAHTIRNRGTRAHAAALALRGTLRWCLSGTPVQNRADDAQPLFAFLRCAPLAEWSVWNRAVGRPVRDGDPAGLARLRLLLRSLSLRRTKALLAHLIPPKTVEVHAVKLDAASREAYDALFRSARSAVAAAAAQGDDALLSLYTPVLECILRLRQAADAAVLVPPARLAAARELLRRAGDASKPALGREEALRLFAALAGALAAPEDNDCCVCLEPLAEAAARVLRACKHTLCDACLGRIAATQPARCPLCRATFTARDVLSKETLASAAETAAPVADEPADAALPLVPPKVAALLEGLSAMAAEGLDRKCVVFSQFTSFIDVMGAHLTAAGWPCARLDGSMPAAARSAALAAWRVPNDRGGPPVLLVSTRAGGVGLNLTSANHCFLMDAWWNAAADEQAMDRVHRLGQTRPVRVIRFVAKDTVEEKMLAMQAAKAALGKGALTKLNADEARTARAADLRSLFEI
jgi:SWI/SNF-related matrix-associated actin-dependent regulator of chromatin subfamily A3